jgi:hypothetical protein
MSNLGFIYLEIAGKEVDYCLLANTLYFIDVFEVQGILMYISKNYALEI